MNDTTAILGIVVALAMSLTSLIILIVKRSKEGHPLSVTEFDREVMDRLSASTDRNAMERFERAFADRTDNDLVRQIVTVFDRALTVIAPLTPIKSDDLVLSILRDVQVPGAPEATVAPEEPVAPIVVENNINLG